MPCHDLFVRRMIGIRRGVEKLFLSREATDVFWRGAMGAVDEEWVVDHRICSDNLLDHAMAPVVAKS